jgi:uncharacterized protein YbaP (TraB family)
MLSARAAIQFVAICVLGWLLGCSSATAAEGQADTCPPAARPLNDGLFQAAAAQAQDRGLLWRISKGGHSSYLYGTLHVGRAEWMAPGPLLRNALQATDTLALELDPLNPDVQREMAAGLARVKLRPLTAALRARLLRQLQAQCLPTQDVDTAPAEMQLITLSALVGRRDGLDPTYGSEVLLSVVARSLARPVVSLETVQEQMDALLARNAAEATNLVREGLDDLETDRLRQMLLRTVQVWDTADFDALSRYREWCQCASTPSEQLQMRRLLDERNPGLAQRVDGLHTGGKKLLVAVGSLHMVGAQGLPALLAQRGYQIERLR